MMTNRRSDEVGFYPVKDDKVPNALAAILSEHRAEIARSWAEKVLALRGTHYAERTPSEIAAWVDTGLDALILFVETGSSEVIERRLSEVAMVRLELGFAVNEVIEGLMLVQEAALPFLCTADPATTTARVAELQAVVRRMIGRFGALFNAKTQERLQQAAVLEERQRLARDLHDSATQLVYAVTLYAEAAARLLERGETGAAGEHLRYLRDTALEALAEMRLLIFELRPPVLESEGLAGALQARLAAVEGRAGFRTSFSSEGDTRPPRPVEEGLHRIAQEALNNAMKHARAQRIDVRLRQHPDEVVLEVADDGAGFDPAAERATGGQGLRGMKERAAALGGTLALETTLGRGTRVTVTVPLQAGR